MKILFLAAALFAAPALAADTGSNVVREFAHNTTAADWVLDGAWTWSDGVLTHISNAGHGLAQQAHTPTLTPGRLYRIDVTFTAKYRVSQGIGTFSNRDIVVIPLP